MSRRVGIAASLVFLSSIFCFSQAVVAATVFYVDPDWQGQADGSASAPWKGLDASAWSTINTALATYDVTVYFSARAAGSDTNQTTTTALNINRTDMSSHLLVLDGMSQYNTNDAAPSWVSYTGSSRFDITAAYPVSTNNHTTGGAERNYWTLQGFHVTATAGQPILIHRVRNVIVQDCTFTAQAGTTVGPGFLLFNDPSIDTNGFGGQHVIIRRNTIHDTYGEGIYVGGWYGLAHPNAGLTPGGLAGDDLLIDSNTIYDMASRGEQGDGIDIKDGWTNITIRNNTIYNTTTGVIAQSEDGIVLNSAALVEGNFIYNLGRVGIDLAGFYSAFDGFWAGTVIRYNIVVNCGWNSLYSYSYGIAYPCATTGCNTGVGSGSFFFVTPQIYNNTVYQTNKPSSPGTSHGIYIDSTVAGRTTVAVYNNIAVGTDGSDLQAAASTFSTHGNSDYWHAGAGAVVATYGSNTYTSATITAFESNSLGVDPQFVNTALPYTGMNFALRSTSPLCGMNLGAVLCAATPPQPPTNLRVQ